MSSRSRKGQAIILIVIVILVIVAVFALLSMNAAQVSSSPSVQQAFWRVDGANVIEASISDNVEAHAFIKANEEYVGSIVMKIRRDVPFWPDSDYSTKTVPVNLVGDQVTELELTFAPDQKSGTGLRGYFIEIDFSASNTNWVMENSYPPRLTVNASTTSPTF
jgi:hypothetical protein